MLIYILQIMIFFGIQESCGTTFLEKGLSGCLSFSFDSNLQMIPAFINRNENLSLCYVFNERITTSPLAWNRAYTCSYSAANFSLCINDVQFSDAGLFSLKVLQNLTQNYTLKVEGPPIVNKIENKSVVEGSDVTVNCSFEKGYPTETTVHWLRFNYPGIYQNGSTLTLPNIQRNISRSFICVAENMLSSGKRSTNESFFIDVQYPPSVINFTKKDIDEGSPLSVICQDIPGNPRISTFYWTMEEDTEFRQNGPMLNLSNIQRYNSGRYICTAENNYSNGGHGKDSQFIDVNVQYKPEVIITSQNPYRVIEGQNATLVCNLKAANPNTSITWKWCSGDKEFPVFENGPTFIMSEILRIKSGNYSCTATNKIGTSEATSTTLDVQYPPVILDMMQQNISEGNNLSVSCRVTSGNPTLTNFYWTSLNHSKFQVNDTNLLFTNIRRENSGIYRCTAENNFYNRKQGTDNQFVVINVQYKPTIIEQSNTTVNEGDRVILSRLIDSNPLSNVSWYNGSEYLITQFSVNNSTFIIEKALCTDTKNFTLVASNLVAKITALVELLVNCKPQIYNKNITLGVTDTTGIEFSTTVIAYPEPRFEVRYLNGTINNQMVASITRNAVNNFTIHVNQTDVKIGDYGVYLLVLMNPYGDASTYVNVIPQRKPDMPIITDYVCEVETARIQWESSFNGGDRQSFTVVALQDNRIENKTDTISDKGKNKIHSTFVQNLQSSTTYVFSVAAHNKHGFSLSKNISCTTLEEEGVHLPLIAGGAVAGGITLAIIVIVIVLMFRRYTKNEERAGKPQRFEDELVENRDTDDDGLKENILYVSADTRDTEKTESAVYAAVNKIPQESHNNANVYAEVNKSEPKIREGALYSDVKPKKGFFKKNEQDKVGGKPKQRKGKKQKTKQEIADVYENSEDIAMTPNVDNVYSNSEHKNQSETKQRGYKNKDGLLYVEVNFDGKQGQDNPVIHGEDEKTDYATVEFPMPSALHKASGSEEL